MESVNKELNNNKKNFAKEIKKQLKPSFFKWTLNKSINGLKNTLIIGSATLTIGSFIFYAIKK